MLERLDMMLKTIGLREAVSPEVVNALVISALLGWTIFRPLLDAGFEVPVFGSFNEEMDPVVAEIETESISDALKLLTSKYEVDAAFVSCTSLRMTHAIEVLEGELGIPVTSSNHAIAWHCMRLAGYAGKPNGLGRLFKL